MTKHERGTKSPIRKAGGLRRVMFALVVLLLASVLMAGAVSAEETGSTVQPWKIGETAYVSLSAAISELSSDATDESATPQTIILTQNTVEAGVVVPAGKKFIIDLGGYTYTVNSPVGSTGTEYNGLQLLNPNEQNPPTTLTIKNGEINVQQPESGKTIQLLIQNYAHLTLDGVKLNGTNLVGNSPYPYTLSNNHGDTTLTGNTEIIAAEDGKAFDVYYWQNSYDEGVSVTIASPNVKIDGLVEFSAGANAHPTDAKAKAALTVPKGYVLKDVQLTDLTSANEEPASPFTNGAYWNVNGDTMTLTGGNPFSGTAALPKELNSVFMKETSGETTTVTLLQDAAVTYSDTAITPASGLTLDLNQKTLTGTLDSSVTGNKFLIKITSDTVTIKNGKIVTAQGQGASKYAHAVRVGATDSQPTLKTENVDVSSHGYAVYTQNGITEISGGKLASTAYATLAVIGPTQFTDSNNWNTLLEAAPTKVTISNAELSSTDAQTISSNGSYPNYEIAITGGKVTSTNGPALYLPSYGKVTLTNTEVSGTNGIDICAGEVTIAGTTTVKATGEDSVGDPNNNGTPNDSGAAIVLEKGTATGSATGYHGNLNIIIKDSAKVTSEKGPAFRNYITAYNLKKSDTDSSVVNIILEGNAEISGKDADIIYQDYTQNTETVGINQVATFTIPASYAKSVKVQTNDVTDAAETAAETTVPVYEITLALNDGTLEDTFTITNGKVTIPTKEPVKEGVKFTGWKLGETALQAGAEVAFTPSMTITAVYADKAAITITGDLTKELTGESVTGTLTAALSDKSGAEFIWTITEDTAGLTLSATTGNSVTYTATKAGTAKVTVATDKDTPETVTITIYEKMSGDNAEVTTESDGTQVSEYPESTAPTSPETETTVNYQVTITTTSQVDPADLPTMNPEFKTTVADTISAHREGTLTYEPLAMFTAEHSSGSMNAFNQLIADSGVQITFSLPKSDFPTKPQVVIFHVKNGNAELVKSTIDGSGTCWNTSTLADSFSSYVLAYGTYPAESQPTTPPQTNDGSSTPQGSSVWLTESQTPTPTETPSEQPTDVAPTDVPTTQPTPTQTETPGFGVLAVLAGLGAVAVLRRK